MPPKAGYYMTKIVDEIRKGDHDKLTVNDIVRVTIGEVLKRDVYITKDELNTIRNIKKDNFLKNQAGCYLFFNGNIRNERFTHYKSSTSESKKVFEKMENIGIWG